MTDVKINVDAPENKEAASEHEIEVKLEDDKTKLEESSVGNRIHIADNPYAYLERNEFTSEKFKLEVRNLPKHYEVGVTDVKINVDAPENKEAASEHEIEVKLEDDKTKLEESSVGNRIHIADNPYAYLERNEFTSEKFKLEVRNLPKHYGVGVTDVKINVDAPENKEAASEHEIEVKLEDDKTKLEESSVGNRIHIADNPYAYLERNEFTSEKFKLEVRNLPKHYEVGVTDVKINVDAPENKEAASEHEIEVKLEDDKTKLEESSVGNRIHIADNPYAYLERNEFTSEKFKLEVRNLPKHYGVGEFKKLLNEKLKLGSNKVKPPAPGSRWMYVCFRSEKERESALKALNGYIWKNNTLSVSVASAAPDPLVKKRKQAQLSENNKKVKLNSDDVADTLKSSTTPLWNFPYAEQLETKMTSIKEILIQLGRDIQRENPALGPWLGSQRKKWNGLPCELWPIRKSPQLNNYRNKCEFSIGKNVATGERTVGFRLSSYARGSTGVGPVDNLPHIPDRMKAAVKVFEKFIKDSPYEVFEPENQTGHWKQLTARLSTHTNELMLIIGIHPQNMFEKEISDIKEEIKTFFTNGDGQVCEVASLYFQKLVKRKAGEETPPIEHLMGATHINEELCGLKFRISPEAFFQINSLGAEVLYNTVAEISNPTNDTCLLDICCGTGTIGLCLSQKCGQVLGLELIPQAVQDAEANAAENKVTNCEFFSGRAEDILSSVICRASKPDLLAVVDPPRAGLHKKALAYLRRTERLNRLVFLSCNPKAAISNFLTLSRPASKAYRGVPYVPVRAVPVDMFPHTSHCELVVYFERYNGTSLL